MGTSFVIDIHAKAKLTAILAVCICVGIFLGAGCCLAGGALYAYPLQINGQAVATARPSILASKSMVTVSDTEVKHRIDQTFYNNNDYPLECLFIYPLTDHDVSQLEIRLNGAVAQLDKLTATQFFPILRDLVEKSSDPSLLELAGNEVAIVRGLNIPIKGQKTFTISYTTEIPQTRDRIEIHLPMIGERYSLAPVENFRVGVRFKGEVPVRSVFSPSHHILSTRETPSRLMVSLGENQKRIREDFRLFATFSRDEIDFQVLTSPPSNATRRFLALVSQPIPAQWVREPDKDVVFVVDTSGSIDKKQMKLASRVISFGLDKALNRNDRFNIIKVGTRTTKLSDYLLANTEQNILDGLKFLENVDCKGGTDFYNGVITGLEQLNSKRRSSVLILIGDGRGTVGITDAERILEDVRKYNRTKVRIHSFIVGNKPDIALMDKLAAISKGHSANYDGKGSFQPFLNRFYSNISSSVMTDISLEVSNDPVALIYPDSASDLFGDDSLILAGETSPLESVIKMKLKAKVLGKPKSVTTVIGGSPEDSYDFVAPLFGMRRMAALLEREWIKGGETGTREQISRLAQEYGFKTPTAVFHPYSDAGIHTPGAQSDLGKLLWLYRNSNVLSDVQVDGFQRVGNRLFKYVDGMWMETNFKQSRQSKYTKFMSQAYFELIKTHPNLGKVLSLGPEIALNIDKDAVVIKLAGE